MRRLQIQIYYVGDFYWGYLSVGWYEIPNIQIPPNQWWTWNSLNWRIIWCGEREGRNLIWSWTKAKETLLGSAVHRALSSDSPTPRRRRKHLVGKVDWINERNELSRWVGLIVGEYLDECDVFILYTQIYIHFLHQVVVVVRRRSPKPNCAQWTPRAALYSPLLIHKTFKPASIVRVSGWLSAVLLRGN